MANKDFDQLPETLVDIRGTPTPLVDELPEYYQTLGDGKLEYLGVETGMETLDKATMGLSGVVVLGGVAGQGKTSLALQIAYETCKKGTPVLFYSLEMPKRAIYTKTLSRLSKLSYGDISLKGRPYLDPDAQDTDLVGNSVDVKGFLTKDEAKALREARDELVEVGKSFYVRSREAGEEAINFHTLEAEINLIKQIHSTDKVLAVVDHLQVFDFRVSDKERASDQIDKESKLIDRFKQVSEKTDTPVLLISQKNKQGFSSSGLESIKGSVDIVYLADVVMFLEGDKDDEGVFGNGHKLLKLVISKNRYNAPRTLEFLFDGKTSTFEQSKLNSA